MTDGRMGEILICFSRKLEKSENSVKLEVNIFLKINLTVSRQLRSSIGGHEHSTSIIGDGVD